VCLAAACRQGPATGGVTAASGVASSASAVASSSSSGVASASSHAFRPLSPAPVVARLDPGEALEPPPRGKVTVFKQDLTVLMGKASRPSFSYENWAEGPFNDEMAALRREEPGERLECLREIKVRALAWIPPFLSLREETYQSCPGREAHPGGETRFTTLQLNADRQKLAGPRPTSMTDFFDAAVLSRALRADPLIVKALGKNAPNDLTELVRALAETPPVLDDPQCYSFPDDLLSRFAFHQREGSRVTVRIGLPGAGPCRYALTEIGLSLPLPAALATERTGSSDDYSGFWAAHAPTETAVIRLHSP
jgi:hypothetical protein